VKICFVAMNKGWGGLANNGGSKTIIRSADALRKLGHAVQIAAVNDKHTWAKHPYALKEVPKNYDAYIACSVSDIDIVKNVKNKKYKFWWCRGFETWQMPEKKIIEKSEKIKTIVNSSWLLEKFPHAQLCYSGLDLEFWKYTGRSSDKLTIGGLWNGTHKTKRFDIFEAVMKKCGDRFNYKVLKDKYNDKELLKFYNECDIWLATSELEGFHQVPAEAALCGNYIVCNSLNSNGMGDYATTKTAMRYAGFGELISTLDAVQTLSKNNGIPSLWEMGKDMRTLLETKIGNREKNMKRFAKIIGD